MNLTAKFPVWIALFAFCFLVVVSKNELRAFQKEIKKLDSPLTVLNYNVWNSFNHNKSYDETIQWVNRVEPDIAAWQELVGWSEQKLIESAIDWKHPYAAALKNDGYNIGLTSKFPIEVIERRTKSYHHGFLHCRTAGIDVIVCHLWPGKRREQIKEAAQIRDRVIELEGQGREVLLMGDFNAHVASDSKWLNQQEKLLARRTLGDEKKDAKDRFIRDGQYTFDVMNTIMEAPINDLVRDQFVRTHAETKNPNQEAISSLGTFPTRILEHANTAETQNDFLERIDFIFATQGLADQCNLASVRRDDVTNTFSDHYPIVATFGIQQADVYLLAGQSNMQGIGKVADLASNTLEVVVEKEDEAPINLDSYRPAKPGSKNWSLKNGRGEIPGIQYYIGRKFDDLIVGETKTSTRKGEFGPEVGLGWQLSTSRAPETANKAIAIVKFYASGQPLHHGWNGNKWAADNFSPGRRNFYPGTNATDVNQGKHYKAMRSHFNKALAELERQGIEYRIAGFAWMQGEQDSKHVVSANAYSQSLRQLKRRVEQDFNNGNPIPMVFGQVLPHDPPLPRFVARDEIRKRMSDSDQDSGHPDSIAGCKMVSTDDFPLLPDTVHYNAKGQWMLGEEFALQLLLLNGK